jgi:hypothetical protein
MAGWTPPTPGDIVWCHFPHLPRRTPGPKPRPALVCAVTEREDGVAVTVAYGTSQLQRMHQGEFAITKHANPAAYSSAGLSFDTKFDLRQSIELPWNEEFFAIPPRAPHGQHPKLGSLHASMMRAVEAAYRGVRGK